MTARLRRALLGAAVGLALAAPGALADEAPPSEAEAAPPPSEGATAGPSLQQGATLAAPEAQPAKPKPEPAPAGGTAAAKPSPQQPESGGAASPPPSEPATESPSAPPSASLIIPSVPSSSCATSGVPPVLVPIYQRAASAYALGPQGAAILAGINAVETAFGTNLNVSSAGAEGWMQFMPSTWTTYGVDANGDGEADPYNPEDAIFAAASYLHAAGMPTDTYGAIFAYNHADWYVAEVLADAACYAGAVGVESPVSSLLEPQLPVLECEPAKSWRKRIPAGYLKAFEDAAGRYELSRRGVWALAAVARLESNFGRGMTKRELRHAGPLGIEPSEWKRYAVDGDQDGHIRHADPADSAATLARLIWSRKSLAAGLFTHNHAEWYVHEVLREAARLRGKCEISYVEWKIAPLPAGLETAGPTSVLAGNLASAPRGAPPAVKAAIAAANSISTTPYIWGGGHGSWISPGYDCSGAVSFALYGAGLLDRPLTSGELEHYGEPGPGRWITIYASPTHTYAEIAGLRWDTVGDASGTGPRWHVEPPYPEGFVVRHPTGY
ncbi:MAG TPA: lytic murein transglycosylase [Solirubrobacterales bacterium]|nr:lytic murein transglycosylase [Solirubrobacterales bacterium]